MNNKTHFIKTLFIISVFALSSCSDDTAKSDTVTLKLQNDMRFYNTIEECIDEADFIVRCTVEEIGEAYLNGNPPTPDTSDESSVSDYIRSIRTPIILEISDIYYAVTDSDTDILTVIEYRGTYNGYTLENSFPTYEKGHEYILFIKQAPDGETNIIMHQGSVEVSETSSSSFGANSERDSAVSPMFNEYIFEGFDTVSDIAEAVEKIKK